MFATRHDPGSAFGGKSRLHPEEQLAQNLACTDGNVEGHVFVSPLPVDQKLWGLHPERLAATQIDDPPKEVLARSPRQIEQTDRQ
jgi:hypothetical protein